MGEGNPSRCCSRAKQPRGQPGHRGEERLSVAVRAGVHQTAPEGPPAQGAAPRQLVQAPSWGAYVVHGAADTPSTQHPAVWG